MKSATKMGVVAVAALAAAACQQATEPTSDLGARPSFALVTGPNPLGEEIVVCKVGPLGSYDFTYSGTLVATGAPVSGGLTVNVTDAAGDCQRLGFFGGQGVVVSITEVVPAGQEVVGITVDQLTGAGQNVAGPTNTVSGVMASGNPKQSAVVTFTNRVPPPPPPPPGGGEGCTPGYWGRSQHFDSWTSPYTTSTSFVSVFGVDAYPGMTLLDVVNNSGPPKKQLGRMAVAALLNAASPGVDFDLTTAEVIAAFNAAWASGEYEATKDMLDDLNNQGCPLN
jgi:hypothetical protein